MKAELIIECDTQGNLDAVEAILNSLKDTKVLAKRTMIESTVKKLEEADRDELLQIVNNLKHKLNYYESLVYGGIPPQEETIFDNGITPPDENLVFEVKG